MLEAEARTQLVVRRSQDVTKNFNLNRHEAQQVGLMMGTPVLPELVKSFRDEEQAIRDRLREARREAGRRYLVDQGIQVKDKKVRLDEVEAEFQETKKSIEDGMTTAKFEIAKIEENLLDESKEIIAEKMQKAKKNLKLLEARLEFAKAEVKAKKKKIADEDENFTAGTHAIAQEQERMEQLVWLLEKYTRQLTQDEVERRKIEILETEIDRAKEHRDATMFVNTVLPTAKQLLEMACRVQRSLRCYRARTTFKAIVFFWGSTKGTISFQGVLPPLDTNFVLSDGPEIWHYYRDYGISIVGPDGQEATQVIKRYNNNRQVQLATPFKFPIVQGMQYRIRFPEDPATVKALLSNLFVREDIHLSGLIGRAQLNRALMSLGVHWDQEDLDELISKYSKVAPQKITCDEYLLALKDHEKLHSSINVDLLRAKKGTLPGAKSLGSERGSSKGTGKVSAKPKNQVPKGKNARSSKDLGTLQRQGSVSGTLQRQGSVSSGVSGRTTEKIGGTNFGTDEAKQAQATEEFHKDEKTVEAEQALALQHDMLQHFTGDETVPMDTMQEEAEANELAEWDVKQNLTSLAELVEEEETFISDHVGELGEPVSAKWAAFGKMNDFSGLIDRVIPDTAFENGEYHVSSDLSGKVAVVDTFLDQHGRVDPSGDSFWNQVGASVRVFTCSSLSKS